MISQLRTCPEKRKAIVSDLYRLHCDGMNVLLFYSSLFHNCLLVNDNVEVVLNRNEEMLRTMIEYGMLEGLVEIFSTDRDIETLV